MNEPRQKKTTRRSKRFPCWVLFAMKFAGVLTGTNPGDTTLERELPGRLLGIWPPRHCSCVSAASLKGRFYRPNRRAEHRNIDHKRSLTSRFRLHHSTLPIYRG